MKKSFFILGMVVMMSPMGILAQQDAEGTSDIPYISRFKGSWILWQQVKNFDRYYILTVKDNKIDKYQVEGKILRTQYGTTEEHSVFEIFKSYEQALKAAGYEILLTLDEKNCGVNLQELLYNGEFSGLNALPREATKPDYQNEFTYFVAKNDIDDRDVYIVGFIVAWGKPLITIDVIEVQSMQEDLVTAKLLGERIGKKGHIALKGIYFETGKAVLSKRSAAALKNISTYLNSHRDKKFFIVGHTDNTGDFELNMALSKERAKAVIKELVSNYGVDPGQLKAYGVANLSPVSTNLNEEGRARNRRVEIVEQ